LFDALTIRRAVAKSIVRSCLIGSQDLQWFLLESGSLRRGKTLKRHETSSWAPQPRRWTDDGEDSTSRVKTADAAAVDAVSLFGFEVGVGPLISWILSHGITPPLAS
jgi:hypothetical protein